MNEESLMKLCDSSLPEKGRRFQYYVIDSATIVGLLDDQLQNADGL
jgi:hypothetical protein